MRPDILGMVLPPERGSGKHAVGSPAEITSRSRSRVVECWYLLSVMAGVNRPAQYASASSMASLQYNLVDLHSNFENQSIIH